MLRCRDGVQSEEVCKLKTGKDAGYRLVMHPAGRSLVLGMSIGGLARVDVTPSSSGEAPQLTLSEGAPPWPAPRAAPAWVPCRCALEGPCARVL